VTLKSVPFKSRSTVLCTAVAVIFLQGVRPIHILPVLRKSLTMRTTRIQSSNHETLSLRHHGGY